MRRSFYLFPDKRGIYHTEILDPQTGVKVCYRTTKTKDRDEALLMVELSLIGYTRN